MKNRRPRTSKPCATCLRRCVVWRTALLASAKTSDGPVGVGTTFDQEVHFLGMSRTNTAVITAYDPPRLFAYKHVKGLGDYEARFTFEPAEAGTRFTVWLEGDSPSIMTKLIPEAIQVRWARKTVADEMNMLKEMLESEVDMEAALAAA